MDNYYVATDFEMDNFVATDSDIGPKLVKNINQYHVKCLSPAFFQKWDFWLLYVVVVITTECKNVFGN